MKELIEALQYLLKFIKNPEEHLVACEHDIMRIWDVDVKAMTLDDVKKLESLGFIVGDSEYDDYYIWGKDGKRTDRQFDLSSLCDDEMTEADWEAVKDQLSECVSSYRYGSC